MSAAGSLGVLVAGGRGRRLSAGHPKALASIAGRTLLERAMALLGSLCDEIVVCAPEEMELPIDAVRRVADPPGAAGPLAGLVAGLAARNFRVALALGVDLPLLRPEMLRGLLAQLGSHLAVLPAPEGVPQPLAAWYAPGALAPLASALRRGERALTPAVLALPHVLVGDDALGLLPGGVEAFLNVNTPEDLARAGERLALAGRS